MDLIVRQARLWPSGDGAPVDVAIRDGRIAAIGPDLPHRGPERQAGGRLLVAGLVETHLHLDKSRLGDLGCAGGLAEAIVRTAQAKATFTPDEVYERACRTLEAAVSHGTTVVRTHVELDPSVGLRGLEGVAAAAARYAAHVDVQVCVYAQEGLSQSPETERLLVHGVELGATVIGGAPYTDGDPRRQIDIVFELARRYDLDVDLHLDLADTTEAMQIGYVCAVTESHGYGGRVAVGHVTQLAFLPPPELDAMARCIADAGVAVTALPATDLFLMGRGWSHARPRGVAPLEALRRHGVTCSVATNNVLNSFTPYGDASLVRMANLYANVAQVAAPDDLADCLSMVTDQAAALLRCDGYGFGIGTPADMVLLDATGPAAAVAEIAPAMWGLKAGRPSFTRPGVELHRASPL